MVHVDKNNKIERLKDNPRAETIDKNLARSNLKNVEAKWITSDDFSKSKFADIMNSCDFDLSYLEENWIISCLECEIDSLEIISKYTLGINDRIECNSRNNIKHKVLIAGTIQIDINDPPYSYGVEFPVRDEPFFEFKRNEDVHLNVPENLLQDSIIVCSFKYPFSNYEQNFTAKVQNYEGCKILINILFHNYEPSVNNEKKIMNLLLMKKIMITRDLK
ncbi:15912_t:CDS:2 [Gigaspora margarita]|uniref:15912_t:CDS:1 n=1 Tax=Gigaspora margarita TaxID=4874 RepID=A0ABM8VZR7_GIGMA|nr:15912_t:CDS:2 [Gigaspora margarita]